MITSHRHRFCTYICYIYCIQNIYYTHNVYSYTVYPEMTNTPLLHTHHYCIHNIYYIHNIYSYTEYPEMHLRDIERERVRG